MAGAPPGNGPAGLKGLVKDKRLWVAAGAAGLLALVMLARRGGASGAGGDSAGAAAQQPSGYYQGGADTTGTDLASWLSQYSASMQGANAEFLDQIKSTVDSLKSTPGETTTPDPVPAAAPRPTVGVKVARDTYRGGELWNLTGISKAIYGNPESWWTIWGAPENAALVAKRGTPQNIQIGDVLQVPLAGTAAEGFR